MPRNDAIVILPDFSRQFSNRPVWYSIHTRKPIQRIEPIVLPYGIGPTGYRIIISALE